MTDTVLPTREALLRLCAASAPQPWYPSVYARETGVPRDRLDEPLTDLRMAGLVELTEWVRGTGQGYVITPLGREALDDPRLLAKLLAGGPAPAAAHPAEPEPPRPRPASRGATAFERGEAIRDCFLHPQPAKVTPVLLVLNVLVFVLGGVLAVRAGQPLNMYLSRGIPAIEHEIGALSSADLVRGEWWRLLSSCFVHWGVLHLVFNMYFLYVLGPLVEQLFGRGRFAVLYLLAGIGGGCAAMLYHPGSPTEPVLFAGASGALWGLMTGLLAWILLNRRFLPPPLVAAWMRQLVFVLLINVGFSFLPFISASGHFGGGAVGFLVASLLNAQRFGTPAQRFLAVVALSLAPVLMVAAVERAMHTDARWRLIVRVEEARQMLRDRDKFREAVAPRVEAIMGRLAATDDRANDLLFKEKRDPEEVSKLRADLARVRDEAEQAREAAQGGPEAWAAPVRDYLAAVVRFLDLLDRKLDPARVDAWGPEQDRELREARRQLGMLGPKCAAALGLLG